MKSLIVATLIRTLHATLRVKHICSEKLTSLPQYIIAFWHCQMLLMLHTRFRNPISVLSSQSRDGDLAVATYKHWGVDAARGSSTRGGGAALRELIRRTRRGHSLAFTPDGPKGPPRVVKSGVIFVAQATGLPIVPIAFAAKKKSCCDRGTGWSSRTRSRARSSCMAIRSSWRVMRTPRKRACGSSGR